MPVGRRHFATEQTSLILDALVLLGCHCMKFSSVEFTVELRQTDVLERSTPSGKLTPGTPGIFNDP